MCPLRIVFQDIKLFAFKKLFFYQNMEQSLISQKNVIRKDIHCVYKFVLHPTQKFPHTRQKMLIYRDHFTVARNWTIKGGSHFFPEFNDWWKDVQTIVYIPVRFLSL